MDFSSEELRLRLIGVAAQTPAVRQHTDAAQAADAAKDMAAVWYDYVMGDSESPTDAGEPSESLDDLM